VLTSVGTWGGSGRWCTFGRTAGRTTRPEWMYSQEFYFEPRAGGEVKIFGFYNNKGTNKRSECHFSYTTFSIRVRANV